MISGHPQRDERPFAGEFARDAATVRAAYRALEDGDEAAVNRYVDPRVAWIHPAVTRLPFDGVLRGRKAVLRAAFRRGEDLGVSAPRISAETFVEIGDGVLVAGRFVGDGDETGEPFLHECFVGGGRILRVRGYPV